MVADLGILMACLSPRETRAHGPVATQRSCPDPEAGCRGLVRDQYRRRDVAGSPSGDYRSPAKQTFQSIAPGFVPERRRDVWSPQPPNEAARPRSPPRRPDAGPGPRKPRPSGRSPTRLVDGDAMCGKLLSSEGPPGLPNALSPSGQPAWPQAPAWPSSGTGRRLPGPGPGPDRRRDVAGSPIERYCSPAKQTFQSIAPGFVPERRRDIWSPQPPNEAGLPATGTGTGSSPCFMGAVRQVTVLSRPNAVQHRPDPSPTSIGQP